MFRDRLRHVLFETRWVRDVFAYAARIASMILRTARFVCALYAEMCINAPAGLVIDGQGPGPGSSKPD